MNSDLKKTLKQNDSNNQNYRIKQGKRIQPGKVYNFKRLSTDNIEDRPNTHKLFHDELKANANAKEEKENITKRKSILKIPSISFQSFVKNSNYLPNPKVKTSEFHSQMMNQFRIMSPVKTDSALLGKLPK